MGLGFHGRVEGAESLREGWKAGDACWRAPGLGRPSIFRGLRPEAGNAGSRGDLSHILSFVAHACAHLSPLQKLDLLKKRKRQRERCIYIYII